MGTNGWPRPVIPMKGVSGRIKLRTSQSLWERKKAEDKQKLLLLFFFEKAMFGARRTWKIVGLLFGKFSAMFADDKDQGRMALSELCFCLLQRENVFQAPWSPTVQRGEGKIREVIQALNTYLSGMYLLKNC